MKKIIWSVVVLLILFSRSMIYTEETKELKPELVVNSGHGDHIAQLVFRPDAKLAATISETAIIIWDVESGRQIKAFQVNRSERQFFCRGKNIHRGSLPDDDNREM